jgi:alpha,alpha-trehalase
MATQTLRDIELVILDLDGVITRAETVHAEAWKQLFDGFLRARCETLGETFEPFSVERDHREYVEGKPRYDGVAAFLESRDIQLPRGNPDDSPDRETVCGLGNRKNQLFQQLIDEVGVTVVPDAVQQIRAWRKQAIKTAVVSSSKNCQRLLAEVDLQGLFDARVDGLVAEQRGLNGKPDPDTFLEAARQLDVDPSCAVVIEDSIAGVSAGRAGGFRWVVGVARHGSERALREHGADIVVRDLTEIRLHVAGPKAKVSGAESAQQVPSTIREVESEAPLALDRLEEISLRLSDSRGILFLDYDGTLTPIVERPEDATLSEAMRNTLRRLADQFTVAIVSGRDRENVAKLVGLDQLVYAGSHGFDISGPMDLRMEQPGGVKCLGELEFAEAWLRERLDTIPGAQVERKRFALAIHFRRVPSRYVEQVERIVDDVHRQTPMMRKRGGKKIFELQPDIPWDKGYAVLWLLSELGLDRPDVAPLYVGDDETDEDAFRALRDRGIGILVSKVPRATAAMYRLPDPDGVRRFLEALLHGPSSPQRRAK